MEKVTVQDLIGTIKDLISNLIIRLDSILEELDSLTAQEIFSNDRIIFMLDDFSALAEGIDIVQKENSSIYLEELTEKLNLLYDSMKASDKLMFKDIIEFELKPLLEHWLEVLSFTVKH